MPPRKIFIDCVGEYPADKEALDKNIEFFPSDKGIDPAFFPYKSR